MVTDNIVSWIVLTALVVIVALWLVKAGLDELEKNKNL